MKKATMIKAIKAVVNKNCVLPIMENVLIQDNFLEVTDLETTVSIPFPATFSACFPADKFLTALDMMDEPVIKNEWKLVNDQYQSAVFITEGKKQIKVTGENPDNFPLAMHVDSLPFNQIGSITELELGYMETGLKFVSHDELRPAMTGIFVGNDIAATDAHRLYWKAIDPLMESIILPAKAVKTLLVFGGSWDIYYNGERAIFHNAEGVTVNIRTIDARYPDYPVVLPQGNGKCLMYADIKEIRGEIKNAMKFANKATNQVNFSINGSVKLHSQDVDFGHEYTGELEKVKVLKKEDITIGFNAKFLDEILSLQDQKGPLSIRLWAPNKAAIINNDFLIMPLMIES